MELGRYTMRIKQQWLGWAPQSNEANLSKKTHSIRVIKCKDITLWSRDCKDELVIKHRMAAFLNAQAATSMPCSLCIEHLPCQVCLSQLFWGFMHLSVPVLYPTSYCLLSVQSSFTPIGIIWARRLHPLVHSHMLFLVWVTAVISELFSNCDHDGQSTPHDLELLQTFTILSLQPNVPCPLKTEFRF